MKLIVKSSNPSNEGATYVNKLVATKSVDLGILGVKESKVTYYISTPKQVKLDTEVELNMDLFNVVEHPFEHPESGETIQLKWLHLK